MNQKNVFQKVLDMHRPFMWSFVCVGLFQVVYRLTLIFSPYVTSRLYNAAAAHLPYRNDLLLLVVLAGLISLSRIIVGQRQGIFELESIDYAVPEELQKKATQRYFSYSAGQIAGENSTVSSDVMSTGLAAIAQLRDDLAWKIVPIVVEVVFATLAMMWLSFELGAMLFVGLTAYSFVMWKASRDLLLPFFREYRKMERIRTRRSAEMLGNTYLIKMNARESSTSEILHALFVNVNKYAFGFWVPFIRRPGFLRSLVVWFTGFAVLARGVWLISVGHLSIGSLAMILPWTHLATGNLDDFAKVVRGTILAFSRVERFFRLMEIKPEVVVVENPIVLRPLRGKIEFRNVTFGYPKRVAAKSRDEDSHENDQVCIGSPVLKNVSCVIPAGRTVAFVGRSGAGKTTFTQLILRAYDAQEGQVLIDDVDIRQLDLGEYLGQVGVVEQRVNLFDESFEYNLLFGARGDSESLRAQMSKVCHAASLDDVVEKLEHGFSTVLGQSGIRLSGGQIQRVGIARALMKDPRIFIFDEATSSLDAFCEAEIRESIETVAQGRTTIIVAHRLSTIRCADEIFYVEGGQIVDRGTHESLMETCASYRTLVRIQMGERLATARIIS